MSDSLEKFKPNIGVFGVGGAGLNAINNMIFSQLEGIDFIAANTDAQQLSHCLSKNKIQLGIKQTRGLGAGANPEVGKISAEESINDIRDVLKALDMVFITAGLGGGTGTGAAPIIAKEAKNLGVLTVAIVTKPFEFEGEKRIQIANKGLSELEKNVDTLIVIPNDNLIKASDKNTGFIEAFKIADDVLLNAVKSVSELLIKPGLVNRDFADLRTVMSSMGRAMIGYGEEGGEDRHIKIINKVCKNEILENGSIDGATNALINITGNDKMTIFEVQYIIGEIRKRIDPEADIIFGTVFDSDFENIRVTIICTGMKDDKRDFFKKKDSDHFEEYKKVKEETYNAEFREKLSADDIGMEFRNSINNFEKTALGSIANEEDSFTNDIEESILNTNLNSYDKKNIHRSEEQVSFLYDILKSNDFDNQNINNDIEESSIIDKVNTTKFINNTEKLKLFQILKTKNNTTTNHKIANPEIHEEKRSFFRTKETAQDSSYILKNSNISNNENGQVPSANLKNNKQKMPLFDSLYSNLIKNLKEDAFEFIKGPNAEIEENNLKKDKVA